MNRHHVRVAAALLAGFLLGLFVASDDAAGQPMNPAPTVHDRAYDITAYAAGVLDRPRVPVPVTAPHKPVTARKTVRAASVASPAVGAVPDLIRAGFARFGPAVGEEAVRVAGCESHFNPTATNGIHAGLFQLSGRYHQPRAARLGYSWAQMWEAGPNIAVAADLYAEQGWSPWTCQP